MANVHDIRYGTFYVVLRLFYQLFTIFLTVGTWKTQHSAIHCLMTNKDEQLYIVVILKIKELIPQLQPASTMSHLERGSRNAAKSMFIQEPDYECWFQFTRDMEAHTEIWIGLKLSTYDRTLIIHASNNGNYLLPR